MDWLRWSAVALVISAVWGVLVWVVARWVFDADDPVTLAFTAGCMLLGFQAVERMQEWRRRARR
jgi:hypothetical protein